MGAMMKKMRLLTCRRTKLMNSPSSRCKSYSQKSYLKQRIAFRGIFFFCWYMGTHNVQCWRTPRHRSTAYSCLRTSQSPSSRRKTLLLTFHWSRDLRDTTKGGGVLWLFAMLIVWVIQTFFSVKMSPFVSQSVEHANDTPTPPPCPKSWIYMYI